MLHSTTEAAHNWHNHTVISPLMHNSPQIRPQTPSSASISRMRCPFPMPPNEGLQDISPAQDHVRKTKTGLLYIQPRSQALVRRNEATTVPMRLPAWERG